MRGTHLEKIILYRIHPGKLNTEDGAPKSFFGVAYAIVNSLNQMQEVIY